jgi:hypothetical protein
MAVPEDSYWPPTRTFSWPSTGVRDLDRQRRRQLAEPLGAALMGTKTEQLGRGGEAP